MRTIADLIIEWLDARPNRSAANLSRVTSVPKSTISSILSGRKPSMEVAFKLGIALPADQVFAVISASDPAFSRFIEKALPPL